ncbi:MAG: HDIG domain-containing protein [Alistipes sp.]|nr:HDIG domain-containing protein [Candidatus Minthomonas equi]
MDENKSILKKWQFYVVLACAVTIVMTVSFPRGAASFKYLYQIGRPWAYEDLISPIDFPILKTEAEILRERDEKPSSIVPYYQYDETVWPEVVSKLKTLLVVDNAHTNVIYELIRHLKEVYDEGIMDDNRPKSDVMLVHRGMHASDVPTSSILSLSQVSPYISQLMVSDTLSAGDAEYLANFKFDEYLRVNLIFSEKKTQEVHLQEYQDISPTKGMFYSGGCIVCKGEIVTSEIARILDSYRMEEERNSGSGMSVAGLTLGRLLLALIVLASMISALFFTEMRKNFRWQDFYYILILLILISLVTALVSRMSSKYIYLVPYPLFALYLMSFYRRYVSLPVYAIMLLPVLLLVQNGVCIYFVNLVAGIAALVSFRHYSRGWQQFVSAFYIFLTLELSYLSFNLLWYGNITGEMLLVSGLALLSSLGVVFAYPLVFLFEKMFSLVSQRRLMELGEINNKLLRELSRKAPGSFQHSLQVANLAGEAAHELDLNEALVRAGALYHDIGKMNNPLCFVENQPSEMNYHAGFSPEDSAQQIIRHVDDGVELARKNKIPAEVIEFILTHHAQDMTRYFYTTYVKNGGNPENRIPFTYHGKLPQTAEQVIVMMADSIEAASRTLGDYSEESIRNLVESIFNDRINGLQLVDADISMHDLTRLKDIFVRKISQIYHDRIEYPKL